MIFASSTLFFCLELGKRHPGLVMVLLGVAGEVICDWKDMNGRLARAKRFSAILLILGLAIEFIEAAKSDRDVSAAIERAGVAEKEAGQANERAAKFDADRVTIEKEAEEIRSTNFVLQAKVIKLEAKTQWRTISEEKKIDLLACLNASPKGKVAICAPFDDQESIMYGLQISNVLSSAGFQVSKYPNDSLLSIGAPGLSITCPDLTNAPIYLLSIRTCFNDNDMPIAVKLPTGFTIESNSVVIVVGPRF